MFPLYAFAVTDETYTDDPEQLEEVADEPTQDELDAEPEESLPEQLSNEIIGFSSATVDHTRSSDRINYGGHSTSYYTANGNTAFCLDPNLRGLNSGTYAVSRYIPRGAGYDLLIKSAYYLYGGPRYNSVKHSFFGDPDGLVAYGLSHAAISFVWSGNEGNAFMGLDAPTRQHLKNVIASINALPTPPSGFTVYVYNEGSATRQAFLGWDLAPGHLEIRKVSSNPSMSDGSSLYSLAGAIFDVFNGSNQKLGSITTDVYGRGRLDNIDARQTGLYIVEVKPPKGFAENRTRIPFEIVSGETVTVTVSNRPQNDPVGILLRKRDADTNTTTPQGDALLEGAEFTVRYYPELYSSESELTGVAPKRTWVLRTDKNGVAFLLPSHLVSGDPFYIASNGDPTLPLGTVTIQETKAPEGYLLNNELFIRQIASNGVAESVRTYNVPIVPENVIRGGVHIEKWDNEIVKHKAQGGATLEGAVFEIVNRSVEAVVVEDILYAVDEVVYTLTTDSEGVAKTSNELLPYGTYEVREVSPPLRGYLATGVLSRMFEIREHGVMVMLNTADTAIRNDPIRGDLRGVKISDGNAYRMADVPFRITSVTTGESHVIITDNNGEFNTSSRWNPHSQNTNRGETSRDGIWFGEIETLNDDVGALLFDTYKIEELRCEANEGRELFTFEVSVYRHNHTINLGTLTNEFVPIPEISTTAMFRETTSSSAFVNESTTIIDTIYYSGLQSGKEYVLKGILMDKDTGEPLLIGGKQVTAEKAFRAFTESGSVTMEFTFNSLTLSGKSVVVFQYLYKDGIEIVAHADINDEAQTVTFESEPTTPTPPPTQPPPSSPQTGRDGLPFRLLVSCLVMVAIAVVLAIVTHKRKKHDSED